MRWMLPPFLRSLKARPTLAEGRGFPYSLELLAGFESLSFTAPVVFLVGENGTGKSTLLETVAILMSCTAMGSQDLERDQTLAPARELSRHLMAQRGASRPRARLFFRAEDAFGFTKRIIHQQEDLEALRGEFEQQFAEGSWAQRLAMGVARGERQALVERYSAEPDGRSHGEAFLELLEQRLVPGGFYVLDEPETPLSPVRVLALLRMLQRSVQHGSQFLVATHSPMLMALPGASIVSCDDGRLEETAWQDVPHVTLMRSFLSRPEAYLRRLAD